MFAFATIYIVICDIKKTTTKNSKGKYNYTTFTNFSMIYFVVCRVYTDAGGIK